jgi:hypothetical protein
MDKTIAENFRIYRAAGFFIMLGALALLVEFILIFFDLASVELPHKKIDSLSIWLPVVTWISLFIGRYISLALYTKSAARFVWVSIMGLVSYTIGSVLIAFDYWGLIYSIPAGLLLTAMGMVMEGIWTLRNKSIRGWLKFTPLLTGLYPFLFMFPTVAIYGQPNYLINYFWGFPWFLFGFYMISLPAIQES